MIQIDDKSMCTGCGACAEKCPKQCISMLPDELGFLYPLVDPNRCVGCGLCENACPVRHPAKHLCECKEDAFAIRSKDSEIRRNSSSGGVFSLLGEKILEESGVVYGVSLSDTLQINHVRASTPSELIPLRGSKVIQSFAGDLYREIEEELQNGKTVYFSGTPCQIFGLLHYLGHRYENLITQDMICHGVCAPFLYEKYLEYLQDLHGSKISSIRFRDKETGWRDYSVSVDYENGDRTVTPHGKDEFMRAYLRNYALRPSCYKCPFKGTNRVSDITLADFWGAEHVVPDLDDNQGLSFVICHTPAGERMIKEVLPQTDYKSVRYRDVIKYNMSGEVSSSKPANNEDFCRDLYEKPFQKVIDQYCKISFSSKVKRAVKSVIKLR